MFELNDCYVSVQHSQHNCIETQSILQFGLTNKADVVQRKGTYHVVPWVAKMRLNITSYSLLDNWFIYGTVTSYTHTLIHIYVYIYIYIYIYIIIIIMHAASSDIPDPLSPLLPIVHRFWQVPWDTTRILTEMLYVGSSWSSCFCSDKWRFP